MVKTISELWERQEFDSASAFHAFCHYRDLKARSIAKAHKEHQERCLERPDTCYLGRWETWSVRNAWVERVAEYDRHLDRKLRAENEAKYKAALERHERFSRLIQSKLIERLSQLKPEDIPVSCIANLAKVAVDMERLALGKPTEVVEFQETDDEMMNLINSDPVLRDQIYDIYTEAYDRMEKVNPPPPFKPSLTAPEDYEPYRG